MLKYYFYRLTILFIFNICVLSLGGCNFNGRPPASNRLTNSQLPFADSHIHFNWDHKELISAFEVKNILKKHGVSLAVVASTPTNLVAELKSDKDIRFVPIFSPYTHELSKRDWYKNANLAQQFQAGLQARLYYGLGEVHFMSGYPPRLNNPVFVDLLAIAAKYDVPSLIHIDSANASLFKQLCQSHPNQRLIFAHAGGNLTAEAIRTLLADCENVWIDLAARDPWRYGGFTDNNDTILSPWRHLIIDYSLRFITGTDPVWRVTRTQSWDQADDGWDHYQELYRYHQNWLAQLPPTVARKIAWDNVLTVYGISETQ